MRIKLSSVFLAAFASNHVVWGNDYDDCYNAALANCPVVSDRYSEGYSEGFADGRNSVLTPSLEQECQPYIIGTRKESAAKLENDLTLTLPILLNANGDTMANNPTKLKYYPKGLITPETIPQGTHAFSVDSLGGNPLPNPSAKATVRLLIINGKFSSVITSTITNDSNNSSTPTFSCNATLNSCEMELNFGNGNENLSIPTPQNATWLGDCTNTDLSKLCNIGINKPYQTVVLIYQNT